MIVQKDKRQFAQIKITIFIAKMGLGKVSSVSFLVSDHAKVFSSMPAFANLSPNQTSH